MPGAGARLKGQDRSGSRGRGAGGAPRTREAQPVWLIGGRALGRVLPFVDVLAQKPDISPKGYFQAPAALGTCGVSGVWPAAARVLTEGAVARRRPA